MIFSKFKIDLSERKKYYLIYSLCFIITAFFVFFWHRISDRTFIWREDGWAEHYKSLIYSARYLRSIIKEFLFQHKLIIPNWDFSIGEGSDILSVHYYTLWDPLYIFSIFFSEDNMYLYYDAAVILRMYISGIAFSMLCFETCRTNKYGILAGAMSYTFCEWMLACLSHPLFLNPMMYFPLLIMGIEKIIRGKRPYLFIVTVAISAMCNIYLFYMLVLAVVIYVVIRLLFLYRKNIKEAARLIIKIGLSSILGLILSAVIFLPLCYVLISNSRTSEQYGFRLFYPPSYYSKLPGLFIAPGSLYYYLCLGFSIPILLAVFLMYYRRKQYQLTKGLLITCIIITLFPIFGRIFNGFAYPTNRWIWAFALLCSYILTLMWQQLMDLTIRDGLFLLKCTVIYFITCVILEHSRSLNVFAQLFLAVVLLFILLPISDITAVITYTRKQQLTVLIVIVSILLNGFWKYSPDEQGTSGIHLEVKQLALDANETAAIAETALSESVDDLSYRYSGRDLTRNTNMLAGISSTQYYWSLFNPNIEKYRNKLDILENRSFDPSNYDDRAGLNSLASVLYYSLPQGDSAPAPYGFSPVESSQPSSYKIYRNDYALPLAYTYDNYMKEDVWETLSSPEKEEAMLEAVVLSEDAIYTSVTEPTLSSYELPYTTICNSNEISIQGNSFVITNENAAATITFDAPPDSEVFFTIDGLQFKESSKYDLYYGDPALDPLGIYDDARWDNLDYMTQHSIKKTKLYWSDMEHDKTAIRLKSSDNESKTLRYYTKDYPFYSGRHNFAANFRSAENGLSSIELCFNQCGVYSFDTIKIICQPMGNYVNQITALRENTLQNITIGTDTVTGDITLDTPGLLCFSIPYSIGWRAYVDGQETKLYQANIMHMALDLDAGTHEIKLIYRTPFLKEGIFISFCGIAIFIMFILVNEKKLRKNKNNNKNNMRV